MIPSVAIKAYVNAPRDDHRWVKELTHEDWDEAFAQLDPPFRPHPEARLHQKACIFLGIAYPQFCYWNDLGSGKSMVALELLRYWHMAGKLKRAVVFVQSDKAFRTWEKQIARWDIGLPYVALEGSSAEKWDAANYFEEGIALIAYAGAMAMLTRTVIKKKKNKNKRGWEVDDELTRQFASRFDAVVYDESTKVARRESLHHKIARKVTEVVPIRYAMAGRPFGRDPTLLWTQQYLIDRGSSLGPTLGLFRAAFFSERKNPFSKYGKLYTFRKDQQKKLTRLTQHRSITYTSDECVDLPKLIPIIESIRLPEEAAAYYKRVVKQVLAARGNLSAMKSAFLHMRQLSSGFLGFKDDDTGERAEVEFDVNPKFDRLLDFMETLPENRKAVIFYEFTHSGRKITKALEEMELKPIWLWSGTENVRKELERFEEDPDCAVAVINHKVGAYSLDGLQIANYLFFYENPVSVMDRDQAQHRVLRQGQRHKVFQYDLVVEGTADRKILSFHKEGGDLFKELLRDPALITSGE